MSFKETAKTLAIAFALTSAAAVAADALDLTPALLDNAPQDQRISALDEHDRGMAFTSMGAGL